MQQAHAQAYPYNNKVGHGLSIEAPGQLGLLGCRAAPLPMRLAPPVSKGKFPLLGNKSWSTVDLSRQRSSGEPLRVSCHFPCLCPSSP
jgi:hypothetical protein